MSTRTISLLLAFVLTACSGSGKPSTPPSSDGGTESPDAATPLPCSGQTGDFHSQEMQSGGETRYYFLHVPSDYACTDAWPLLVDFHGTGVGQPTDPVEEDWAYDEMLAAADAEHFIVVRPRSRFAAYENGEDVFQWDINPGDPDKNRTYATALIADLETRYHIDPARVYAAGFSNGPSQALQFLLNDPPLVHGYMIVSGGLNEPLSSTKKLTSGDGRVYVSVGFDDYMWSTTRTLYDFLGSHGFDMGNVWRRESNTGHELYGWHYVEAFRWLDGGKRNAAGTLNSGWTAESLPDAASITALALDGTAQVHATAEGGIFRRSATGVWAKTLALPAAPIPEHMTSLCFLADGTGVAVGEADRYVTTDGASWQATSPVTEEWTDEGFGGAYINAVACTAQTVVAAGLWSAESTSNGGSSWSKVSMALDGESDLAFVTRVRRSAAGTYVASGYWNYLGRSTDGITFTAAALPGMVQWWNDVAPDEQGGWWAVGEKGNVLHSTDDGVTFTTVTVPTTEDLYAVSFYDAMNGIVAGSHGAVLHTSDGGASWTAIPTGLDGYIGAALWLDAQTVLVAGEQGTVLVRKF